MLAAMGFIRDRLRKMLEEELEAALLSMKANPRKVEIPVQVTMVSPKPEPSKPVEEKDKLIRGYYWSDSWAHWNALKEFQRPTPLERFEEGNQRATIERSLNEPLTSAVKSFLRSGLLEEVKMHASDWLVFLYSKREIQVFCAELDIEDAAGTKDELAHLLWEYDREFVQKKARSPIHYILTELGLRTIAVQSKNKVLMERVRRMDEGETD